MLKLTLAMIMVIMKYQGSKGKYYTLQKASALVSGIMALFTSSFIHFLPSAIGKGFILYVFFFLVFFVCHYIWLLNFSFKGKFLHYKEYKVSLMLFLSIITLSFLFIYLGNSRV